MFFYRDTVVHAKTREELFDHSDCPICKSKLVYDWKMPLRYEPMALFRMGLIGGTFATLLCLLLVKAEERGWLGFLNRFSYTMQTKIPIAFLVCICLPAAFFAILGEIKLGHLTRDDAIVYGLRCPTCGNGFAGLVGGDDPGENVVDEETAIESNLSADGSGQPVM